MGSKEAIILKEKDPFEKEGLNQWQIGIDEWLKDKLMRNIT